MKEDAKSRQGTAVQWWSAPQSSGLLSPLGARTITSHSTWQLNAVGSDPYVVQHLTDGFVSRADTDSIVMLNDLANRALGDGDELDFDVLEETIRSNRILESAPSNTPQRSVAKVSQDAKKSGAVSVVCTLTN
jgi:hypothetical protein